MITKQLLGRTRRARRNLALKLVLERRFLPELSTYFNNILKSFRAILIATGEILPVTSFNDETKALLKKQYLRTTKAFSNEMRLAIDPTKSFHNFQYEVKQDEGESRIDELIAAALILFTNQVTPERSQLIDQTTLDDMSNSVTEAGDELFENNQPLTNASIGIVAARKLKRKFDGRKKTIAITETQFMAESTKAIESAVISSEGEIDIGNIIPALGITLLAGSKRWASILDGKTRTGEFNHVDADGQKVKMNEPFIVSGQRLGRPGDRSLGASIGNTINCRCSALYGLV